MNHNFYSNCKYFTLRIDISNQGHKLLINSLSFTFFVISIFLNLNIYVCFFKIYYKNIYLSKNTIHKKI